MVDLLNIASEILAKEKNELLNTHKLWEFVSKVDENMQLSYDEFYTGLKKDERFIIVKMKEPTVLGIQSDEKEKLYPLVYLKSNPPDRELALSTLENKVNEAHNALLKGWETLPKESDEIQQEIMIKLLSQIDKIKNEIGELKSKLDSLDDGNE